MTSKFCVKFPGLGNFFWFVLTLPKKKKRKEEGKPTYENTAFPICFADESRKAGTCELVGGILSDFSINQKVDSWWRILVEAETDADADGDSDLDTDIDIHTDTETSTRLT